jgi:hypothetical protein
MYALSSSGDRAGGPSRAGADPVLHTVGSQVVCYEVKAFHLLQVAAEGRTAATDLALSQPVRHAAWCMGGVLNNTPGSQVPMLYSPVYREHVLCKHLVCAVINL